MSDQQPKHSRFPSVDPGLASIVAAVLTLIGVLVTVLVQWDPGPEPVATPVAIVAEAATVESTPVPTVAPAAETAIPAVPAPEVQIISQLPSNQAEAVREGAAALLQVGRTLPLMVKDEFETRDYGWLELEEIIQGGGECEVTIAESAYRINVQSAAGAVWCSGGLPRQAADFQLSADLELAEDRNADVFLFYRLSSDQQTYYSVGINPQTQVFWANVVEAGQDIPLVPQTFAEHINPEGTNTVSLVATGPDHALYFNDRLELLFTDERITTGTFGFSLTLLESNANETLVIDNFELRGQ